MLQQATAQPIPGLGVQFWRIARPRVAALIVFTAVVFHAIMPAMVCFVDIAYEVLCNQPGPALWQ